MSAQPTAQCDHTDPEGIIVHNKIADAMPASVYHLTKNTTPKKTIDTVLDVL